MLLAAAAAVATFFALGLDRYLTLAEIKNRHAELLALYEARPARVVAAFMAIQITALALCLPGAVLTLSLAGGAIFGFAWGTLIVLASITIGDSVAFLAARYLLRDWVERRFARYAAIVDKGVAQGGAFYLLSLRLMAVIPFFIVNLTMGLTRMSLRIFAPVSFVGLVPATALYVYAGTTLPKIDSAGDIYSRNMLLAFLLLAILPLGARFALRRGKVKLTEPSEL